MDENQPEHQKAAQRPPDDSAGGDNPGPVTGSGNGPPEGPVFFLLPGVANVDSFAEAARRIFTEPDDQPAIRDARLILEAPIPARFRTVRVADGIRRAYFLHVGDAYRVAYDKEGSADLGKVRLVKSSVGVAIIAYLLASPRDSFPADDLVRRFGKARPAPSRKLVLPGEMDAPPSAGTGLKDDLVDADTYASLTEALAERREHLADAERLGHHSRAATLKEEVAHIERYLRQGTRPGGAKRSADVKPAEKARSNVRHRLGDAYDAIVKAGLPDLAAYFKKSIQCEKKAFTYNPGADAPVWVLA